MATGDAANAYQAYLDGAVASNLLAMGDYGDGYDEDDIMGWTWFTVVSVGQANLTLELVMRQKYIAGYNTSQPFVDWRRTGFPVLARANGATTDIPRRFPYPQSELDYNSANASTVSLQDKLWWDQ